MPYLYMPGHSVADHYQYILSLLRAGALEQAEREYLRLGLQSDTSNEDTAALSGRILKARALEHDGAARQKLALKAAREYQKAYDIFSGAYSGINTAALYYVGGEKELAHNILSNIEKISDDHRPATQESAYYQIATASETALIREDYKKAETLFADAIACDPTNYEAHASTLKQFEMVLTTAGAPQDWLDRYRPPAILHFAGHMFHDESYHNGTTPDSISSPHDGFLEDAIETLLENHSFSAAYGALAAGSDILIAEALLRKEVKLHVVQPCPDVLFDQTSIAPYGTAWRQRFDDCMKSATSIRYVSQDTSVADELTNAFASETAMGFAVLEAERLATSATQIVIWDQKKTSHKAGTARDAAIWHQLKHKQHIIPYPLPRPPIDTPKNLEASLETIAWQDKNRQLRAMLFADVRGFSQMTEKQIPIFINYVLEALAECAKDSPDYTHCNTWGDGLFLTFQSVKDAATCATRLHTCFRNLDLVSAGLPHDLALRIGGHYGPVYVLIDPFLEKKGPFGREVTHAARIEEVTAPGSIFVSEPFAAALAITTDSPFRCEPIPTPIESKDQGLLTLYSLRKRLSESA